MRILIAYGTTEGQTRKIVQAISAQLAALGDEVETFDTSGLPGDLHPQSFDRIIVAGSVHEQRHQESVEIFAMANRETLQAKPTLFISVSIAAAFEDTATLAQSYVDAFVRETGWQPGLTLPVAGAVRHGEYDYYREHILEHVVLKGRNIADPVGEREFTDWDALARAIDAFVEG